MVLRNQAITSRFVIPAKEPVKELKLGWTNAVRPSRRPRSLSSGRPKAGPVGGLLRIRNFLNAIKDIPHPEDRLKGASRRTHRGNAANSFTRSKAGVQGGSRGSSGPLFK